MSIDVFPSQELTDTQLRATAVPVSIAAPVTVVNAGTFGVQADTELPAATSQADATGNPTAPVVGAFLSGWNGSSWDRVKTVNTGQLKTTLYDASGNAIFPTPAALADGASNPTTFPVRADEHLWNGATWDRKQGKEYGTLLSSASRNANTAGTATVSRTAQGVILYLNVTAYPGVGNTLYLILRSYDPVTNNVTTVYASSASTIAAVGTYTFELSPGSSTAHPTSGCGRSAQPLPYKWDAVVVHATGSGNWTYSLQYQLVP